MSSFWIKEKTKKSFENKISKLAPKTKLNVYALENSFKKFGTDFHKGGGSEDIFESIPHYQIKFCSLLLIQNTSLKMEMSNFSFFLSRSSIYQICHKKEKSITLVF